MVPLYNVRSISELQQQHFPQATYDECFRFYHAYDSGTCSASVNSSSNSNSTNENGSLAGVIGDKTVKITSNVVSKLEEYLHWKERIRVDEDDDEDSGKAKESCSDDERSKSNCDSEWQRCYMKAAQYAVETSLHSQHNDNDNDNECHSDDESVTIEKQKHNKSSSNSNTKAVSNRLYFLSRNTKRIGNNRSTNEASSDYDCSVGDDTTTVVSSTLSSPSSGQGNTSTSNLIRSSQIPPRPLFLYQMANSPTDSNHTKVLYDLQGYPIIQLLPARIDLTPYDTKHGQQNLFVNSNNKKNNIKKDKDTNSRQQNLNIEIYSNAVALFLYYQIQHYEKSLQHHQSIPERSSIQQLSDDKYHPQQYTVLVDVRAGLGWKNLPVTTLYTFIKVCINCLYNIHPGRLHRCIVYPVPAIAIAAWYIIKQFISPSIVECVVLLSGPATSTSLPPFDQLQRYISIEAINQTEATRTTNFFLNRQEKV